MRLLLATLLASAALAPAVTTGPAESVGQTTATLTGSVDPNGADTSYHFEYGTSTEYGRRTDDKPAGAGDLPVVVKAPVDGLAASTTYHYRLVAGGETGADANFTTAAAPAVPGIARLLAVDKTARSARLTARMNPHGAATTWRVEWGMSPSLGRRTPDRSLPAGTKDVGVSTTLGGLAANRRVYWRVVATNAAGVKHSGTASFTTLRVPTALTLIASPRTVTWSAFARVRGHVSGAGVSGITVALEQITHPFGSGFAEVARARADRHGDFAFISRRVFLATRYRAVIRNPFPVTSTVAATLVRPRVVIRRTHETRRAVRVGGTVNPGLPAGRATLQRRSRSGGWTLVRRAALRALDATHSTYAFNVKRRARSRSYRVVIAPGDAGAHVPARSRAVVVGRKQRR